jgi:hypothetical protein
MVIDVGTGVSAAWYVDLGAYYLVCISGGLPNWFSHAMRAIHYLFLLSG